MLKPNPIAIAGLLLSSTFSLPGLAVAESRVQFDMPPVAAARSIATSDHDQHIQIELRLSSMLTKADVADVDQWLVRVEPRDQAMSIIDYTPRTETASEVEGPIQVRNTSEKAKAFGLSLDGAYGHLARIHSGFDQSRKNVDSVELDRVPPVHVVTAAGTINRGRGVYFKLRWTAQQVLEGEKKFEITYRVPVGWRSGLLDVSVIAQSQQRSFPGWESETRTVAAAQFVVAAYLQGDQVARQKAHDLFTAETELRILVQEIASRDPSNSFTTALRHVAMKLDLDADHHSKPWVDRLVADRADPHQDKQIRSLPMPLRVAALEYADARDELIALNGFEP